MDGRGHGCLVCGQPITWQFAICARCENTYGRTSREWPRWLAYLWADHVRERRRNKTIAIREVTASDLSPLHQVEFHEFVEDAV